MIEAPLVPELKCDDYKASYNFYTEILEFKVLYVRENEGFAMFEHEGSQIMIDSLSVCSRFVDGVMEKPYGRGVSFQIRTSDVSKVYERIVGNDHPIFLFAHNRNEVATVTGFNNHSDWGLGRQ